MVGGQLKAALVVSKCADADGGICDKQTVGLLRRQHVCVDLIKYIGMSLMVA